MERSEKKLVAVWLEIHYFAIRFSANLKLVKVMDGGG